MSGIDDFRGYSPKEVAEMTRLYGEHQLRRMCAEGKIAHHRGGMNRVIFFREDIEELKQAARKVPSAKPAETQLSVIASEPEQGDPFRSTSRSRSAHRRRQTT